MGRPHELPVPDRSGKHLVHPLTWVRGRASRSRHQAASRMRQWLWEREGRQPVPDGEQLVAACGLDVCVLPAHCASAPAGEMQFRRALENTARRKGYADYLIRRIREQG